MTTSRIANREVLSNLCDKIQTVSGLMNGHVRRMFNLESFVEYVEVEDDDREESHCDRSEADDFFVQNDPRV